MLSLQLALLIAKLIDGLQQLHLFVLPFLPPFVKRHVFTAQFFHLKLDSSHIRIVPPQLIQILEVDCLGRKLLLVIISPLLCLFFFPGLVNLRLNERKVIESVA